ncbi:FUSC family protein [Starkeya sp. ORNL1]|uniref:FUSC family protein n=1 Tax=Starkeya sp. ORNL1 TaxID=2709380 RepID=UPI00146456E6|nr:aromatic acid exporter family protein [Starkeya sp. ORNL1]QJP15720.1 FUSC family protein [Starkeya sp. ORNL1]
MNHRTEFVGVLLALRVALAAAIAFALADFLQLNHPIYAFIAAVIVTDRSPQLSRKLGLTRIASTIVGAATGAALSQAMGPGVLSLGFSVLVAMIACQALRMSDGAKVAGYICGLILIEHRGEPWTYALDRFIETLLGVIVAWGVSAVPHLIRIDLKDEGP